jgi:lysine-specific demethylase/histidyl-hydroxylase NO66
VSVQAGPLRTGTTEGGASAPALRRCTAVDPDRFAAQVWGREASLSPAARLPASFDDLFDLAAADRLLSEHGLRSPFLRVVKDGATLPTGRFTAGGGVGAGIADQASDARLARLFADGATVVLQALHRTHAPLIAFARQLGADLGHPVQINAYLTPPQSQGFSAHYDVHDVFVLQVAGEKRWRVHAPVVTDPLPDDPWTDHRAALDARVREQPVLDEVLRPGDALYLPRGFVHAATARGETAAHLTVGVHVWTRQHLLEALVEAVRHDPGLRTSLPLGIDVTDPAQLTDDLGATLAALLPRLAQTRPDDLTATLAGRVHRAARAEPVAPLAQAAAAARVSEQDRVRWRAGMRATVREDGDELVVTTPDGASRLPVSAADAIARLRAGGVVDVAGIGVETARLLLRACLVVLVEAIPADTSGPDAG